MALRYRCHKRKVYLWHSYLLFLVHTAVQDSLRYGSYLSKVLEVIKMPHTEPHFLDFIAQLEVIKDRIGDNSVEVQEKQVNDLLAAEKEFRKALVCHPEGPVVFQDFIKLILEKKRNILMARPYFRERDSTFKAHISMVLRKRLYRQLYRFNFNFQFISWAVKSRQWLRGGPRDARKLLKVAAKCSKLRQNLIEANLPLAISQARIFYVRNRHGHQAFMDMIQVAAGGLAAGVDKFVGPYTKTFRAVLIGRILGDLIEANSETFVHFFPADKRRIYRVRKIISSLREGAANADYDQIAHILNRQELGEGETPTSSEDLQQLMAAATVVHSGSLVPPSEEDGEEVANPIEKYAADAENRPDNLLEEAQLRRAVAAAIGKLSVFDQKLLRLRGVDLSVSVPGL